jgi:hypothetical protein
MILTGEDTLSLVLVGLAILFILHCPIFKPWFGFRRPPDHRGKWGE